MRSVSRSARLAHKRVAAFLRHDQGLSITEYAIAAGLIAAAVVAAFFLLGTTVNALILAVTVFL